MDASEERGWLIESEREGYPCWWSPINWSNDSLNATRFCRKQDAEEVIGVFEIPNARATEHIWVD